MNSTAAHTSYSSDSSWFRLGNSFKGSDDERESVLSIQGKETDFVKDTSDSEWGSDDAVEYEPVSEPGTPDLGAPLDASDCSSGETDNEIIRTQVISVVVRDDGDYVLADSESSLSVAGDSELDPYDYWRCAQCNSANNNPLYRYCERCYKVRKTFFPARPKRKQRNVPPKCTVTVTKPLSNITNPDNPPTGSQTFDSGVESPFNSQEMSNIGTSEEPSDPTPSNAELKTYVERSIQENASTSKSLNLVSDSLNEVSDSLSTVNDSFKSSRLDKGKRKRTPERNSPYNKRRFLAVSHSDSSSDESETIKRGKSLNEMAFISKSSSDIEVQPVVKALSEPSFTTHSISKADNRRTASGNELADRKVAESKVDSAKQRLEGVNDNTCIICSAAPKSGVFVHGSIAHICCCYKCALKVWAKAKRCPVCNCRVSNVLKAIFM